MVFIFKGAKFLSEISGKIRINVKKTVNNGKIPTEQITSSQRISHLGVIRKFRADGNQANLSTYCDSFLNIFILIKHPFKMFFKYPEFLK
jgi:hypothetical protein